jgi:hypothetical protein
MTTLTFPSSPTSGQKYTGPNGVVYTYTNGKWVGDVSGGGSGTPGGSNTQIQFNNNGSFGGNTNFTIDAPNLVMNTANIISNNITANYFSGDGSNITNIQIANFIFPTPSSNTSTIGVSDGSDIVINPTYGGSSPAYINVPGTINGSTSEALQIYNGYFVGNASAAAISIGSSVLDGITIYGDGSVVGSANITANYFIGDGSQLSNITYANVTGTPTLSTVATSGSYSDLINKPTIPDGTYANLTGKPTLGNLSSLNKDGNSSNVLYGNGVFASIGSNYGNSNVANYLPTYTGNLGNANNITANTLIVIGNANVQGTLTYNNLSSLTTSNLVLGLGNNQTGINVTGGGIVVGNTAEASFTYNYSSNVWSSNIGINATGNVTGGNINTSGQVVASTITSNVATGTAPFIVTSTTQVANLNVANAGLATYATTANSVAVANVVGIGNIATINKDGNSSNILYGNGVFASAPVTYGNSNVSGYLASFGSNTISTTGSANVGSANVTGNLSANNANITNYLYVGSTVSNLFKNAPLTVTGANAGNTITGINIVNTGGGGGSGSGVDFYTYTGAGYPPEASIYSVDNGDYSANINFATKVPGAGANILATRMTVASNGNVVIPGNLNVSNITLNGQPTTYGVVNGSYLFATNTSDQNNIASGTAVIFQNTGFSLGTAITKLSNTQVTLAAGNSYKLEGIFRSVISNSTWATFQWYDVTNAAYVGVVGFGEAVTSSATGKISTVIATYYVTPSVNTTYELRSTVNSPNVVGGEASYEITQLNPAIAVQATATGTVNNQYSGVTLTSNQVIGSPGTPTNIVFQSATGTVPYSTSTGVWTLTSGVTYNLSAVLAVTGASNYLGYQWVDSVSGTALSTALGFATLVTTQVSSVPLSIVYTPNTNQTIALRNVNSQYASVIANYSWATVTQINQAFALNTLGTMTTTGNVSVGGNLSLTGSFQGLEPSYTFADDSASASWYLLGTWNTVQSGQTLYMKIISHQGYNGVANQNQVTELIWAASNGTSTYNGATGAMYAAGNATINSRLGTGNITYQAPSKFRVVQVSSTQYQIYGYFGAYTRGSTYSVQTSNLCSWVHSGTPVSTPGGNYLEFTPTTY